MPKTVTISFNSAEFLQQLICSISVCCGSVSTGLLNEKKNIIDSLQSFLSCLDFGMTPGSS